MKIEETVCVYNFFFHGMLEFGNNIFFGIYEHNLQRTKQYVIHSYE